MADPSRPPAGPGDLPAPSPAPSSSPPPPPPPPPPPSPSPSPTTPTPSATTPPGGPPRRPRWRLFAWIAAAAFAVPLVLAAVLVATVDAGRLLPLLERQVHERTGRTLAVAGGAKLSVWPRPALVLGEATLSEPRSRTVFARVGSARFAAALLPLLHGELAVDRIAIDGLRVELVRHRDGSTNVDDLLHGPPGERPAAAPGGRAPPHWTIAGIDLRDASIGWRDERDGTALRALVDTLSTGEIGPGAHGSYALKVALKVALKGARPGAVQGASRGAAVEAAKAGAPALDLAVEGRGDYRIADAGVRLSGVAMTAQGRVAGRNGVRASVRGDAAFAPADAAVDTSSLRVTWEDAGGLAAEVSADRLQLSKGASEIRGLAARIRSTAADGGLDLKVAVPDGSATGPAFTLAPVVADLDWRTSARHVTGRVQTPVALDLRARTVALRALRGSLAASGTGVPGGAARIGIGGRIGFDAGQARADAHLALRLDEGRPGAASVDIDAVLHADTPRRVEFDLTADRLDLDRWRTPPSAAPKPSQPPPAGGGIESADLRARGRVRVGALTVAGLQASALDATVAVDGPRITVDPVRASLYDGRLNGRATYDLAAERWTLRQSLADLSVGPLLRALSGHDLLEGRGTVDVDLASRGSGAEAMRRALGGTARLKLADGAIRGIDLAGALRRARAIAAGQPTEVAHASSARTDFTSLTASFVIRDGVASNDDLDMRSPFVRVDGAGRIDAGSGTLDYVARVSLVASASGQGGQERDALRGLTVPVRAYGPLNALRYRLALDRAVVGAAHDALRERAREALEREVPGLSKDSGKLGDEIGRRLQGLFER